MQMGWDGSILHSMHEGLINGFSHNWTTGNGDCNIVGTVRVYLMSKVRPAVCSLSPLYMC